MDFTNFINSKDIRDYHREIGYKYNTLEAAWLVYQCDIPLIFVLILSLKLLCSLNFIYGDYL